MTRQESQLEKEDFDQQLNKLRLKIDLLPEKQRWHLRQLADTIAEQHERLQNRKSVSHDVE